jgi:hypothetical protein
VGARKDIIAQGDREDGRRQVVALFAPGDLCDLKVFILRRMDHSSMRAFLIRCL